MYSLFGSTSKSWSKKASGNADQDWVVVEQKNPGKKPLPSDSYQPSSARTDEEQLIPTHRNDCLSLTSTKPTEPQVSPQHSGGIDPLISSINTQRLELAEMRKAFVEGQAQIQEGRDLFQAQYYALRIQQEEREAHQADEKEAAWKADLQHLRAEIALKLSGKSDELQYLRADVDDVKKLLSDESGRLAHVQEQVDRLKLDHECQSAALVEAMEQLRGQVAQIAGQTTYVSAAVAQLKIENNAIHAVEQARDAARAKDSAATPSQISEAHGDPRPIVDERATPSSERRNSRASALDSPIKRQRKRAKVNKTLSNEQDGQRSHQGVGIPPENCATIKGDTERGKYDCEWYLQQPW